MKPLLFVLTLTLLFTGACSAATIVMTAPVRYRSVQDSPYLAQHMEGSAYLEDFEDIDDEASEGMNLGPGGETKQTPLPGLGGGRNTSVDGDDGVLDGIARSGRGWSSSGDVTLEFMDFEIVPLAGSGELPVWFGFAVTHANAPNPAAITTMQIIGVDNVLLADLDLTALEVYIRSIPLGPGSNPVGNDVFVSWQSSEPIEKIRIDGRHAIVIDHFQFGYTIPEPSSAVLLATVWSFSLRRSRGSRVPVEQRGEEKP